jgi:hypothetical protein
MRLTLVTGATLAVALLAQGRNVARAQDADPQGAVGTRVRITWCEEIAGRCEIRHRTKGELAGRDSAAVHLRTDGTGLSVPWHAVRRMEVFRGTRGPLRTVAFAAGGSVLGGVAGWLLGVRLPEGDCIDLGCLAGPYRGLTLGAAAGLIAGLTVALRSRDRWTTTYRASARLWIDADRFAGAPRLAIGVGIPTAW